jgi:hypothetical protein
MRKREEELFVVELFVLTYSQLCLMSVAQMEDKNCSILSHHFFKLPRKRTERR